jgi:hypothetical protein
MFRLRDDVVDGWITYIHFDYRLGYIPLSVENPNYQKEVEQEKQKGFPKCTCSNCEPESSQWVMDNFKRMTTDNFNSFISDSPKDIAILNPPSEVHPVEKEDIVSRIGQKPLEDILEKMAQELVKNFDKLFYNQMKDHAAYPPSVYFSITQARKIGKNVEKITSGNIQKLIGSETIPGQMVMLVKDVKSLCSGEIYNNFLILEEKRKNEIIRNAHRLCMEKEDEDNKKNKVRQTAWEAAALKKAETSARVAANAERKRVVSEARSTANKKKQAKKESDMATLQELKAQARNNQTLASTSDQASTSRAVNESIDLSLFHS